MKKTYTQKVHYRIVIEGDYSIGNLYEEELFNTAEETHDLIWGMYQIISAIAIHQ